MLENTKDTSLKIGIAVATIVLILGIMTVYTIQEITTISHEFESKLFQNDKLQQFKILKSNHEAQYSVIQDIILDSNYQGKEKFWIYGSTIKETILRINEIVSQNTDQPQIFEIQKKMLELYNEYLNYEESVFKAFVYLEEGKKDKFLEEITKSQKLFQNNHEDIVAIEEDLREVYLDASWINSSFYDFITWQIGLVILIGILILLTSFFLNRINRNLKSEVQAKTNELKQANENLKELDKKRSEFISVASHELKGPLQPIMGFVDLAKSRVITSKEALDGISSLTEHLENVANNVLDLSKIEQNNLNLNLERCKINDIIKKVVEAQNFNPQCKVPIRVNFDREVSLEIDKTRIRQVLRNILDNCIRFTDEGEIRIQTYIINKNNKLKISISDTGPKIPDEYLTNMFDRYVTDKEKSSFGLGLYISKKIIEAHNGTVTAYNKNGKPVFDIILPIIQDKISLRI